MRGGFSNYTESIGSEFKKEMRKVYATGKFQMIQFFYFQVGCYPS